MMKLIYIPEHFQEHEQSLKQIDHFSLVQVHDIEECKLQIHPLNQDVILFNRSFLDIANITVFSQELKQVSSAVKIVVFDQTPDRGQAFENIEYIDLVIEQLEPGAVLYDQLIGLENEDKTVLINKKDLVAGLNGNEGLIIDETQEINFSLGDDRVEAEELTLKTSPNLEQVNQDEEELGLHLLLENNEEEALEITETFIKPEGLEHNDEATLIVPSASGEESSFEQVDASAEIDFIEMPLDLDEKFSSELDSKIIEEVEEDSNIVDLGLESEVGEGALDFNQAFSTDAEVGDKTEEIPLDEMIQDAEIEQQLSQQQVRVHSKIENDSLLFNPAMTQFVSNVKPELSSGEVGEVKKLQLLVGELRSQIRRLELEKGSLEKDKIDLKRSFDQRRGELEDSQNQFEKIRLRYEKDIQALKDRITKDIDEKLLEQVKGRKKEEDLIELRKKVHLELVRVQSREKELQSQLDLVKMDSDSQIQNRENMILDLKRKIDLLQFDLEQAVDSEQRIKRDYKLLEEKLDGIMKKLRGAFDEV